MKKISILYIMLMLIMICPPITYAQSQGGRDTTITINETPDQTDDAEARRRERRAQRRERERQEARRRWTVRQITFTGNDEYRRRELLSIMELRPRWPRYDVRFTNFLLNSDMEVLRTFYRGRGFEYVDVKVDEITWDTAKSRVRIRIAIDEGPRVHISEVDVQAERIELRRSQIRRLAAKEGNPLVHADVRQDVRSITTFLGNQGYLAANVSSQIEIEPEDTLARVSYLITEGPRLAVGATDIVGNDDNALRRSVIRRELTFRRGDTLNLRMIRQSERRLYSTSLFNYVFIEPLFDTTRTASELPDSTYDVRVHLSLSDFFRVQGRVGYSTDEGPLTSGGVSYMNMFRRGQTIGFEGRLSYVLQGAEVFYTIPGLFFMPFSFNTRVYHNRYDSPDQYRGAFSGIRLSIDQRTEYFLMYQLWTQWERLEWIRVPSPEAIYEDGVPDNPIQSIGGNVGLDTRNNLFNPTSGSYTNIGLEVAGLLSEENQFIKMTLDMRRYFNYRSRLFLSTAFRTGYVYPYGKSDAVPIQSKFYGGGGTTVRGFPVNRLAIIESDDGDIPMMGDFYVFFNVADVRFPLFWWINGAVFLDAGNVWTEFPGITRSGYVFNDLRWSAGPGIRIDTPIRLVARLDMGFKLDRREGESKWELHFDLGQPF